MATQIQSMINNPKLTEASKAMRAFTHPLRLKILSFINEKQSINVNKIYRTLKMEQSIASQHLRILREANLVLATRNGKFIFYQLNYKKIDQIARTINKYFS